MPNKTPTPLEAAEAWLTRVTEHFNQEDPDPWIEDVRDGADHLRVALREQQKHLETLKAAEKLARWVKEHRYMAYGLGHTAHTERATADVLADEVLAHLEGRR
jgi:hypothetical protein